MWACLDSALNYFNNPFLPENRCQMLHKSGADYEFWVTWDPHSVSQEFSSFAERSNFSESSLGRFVVVIFKDDILLILSVSPKQLKDARAGRFPWRGKPARDEALRVISFSLLHWQGCTLKWKGGKHQWGPFHQRATEIQQSSCCPNGWWSLPQWPTPFTDFYLNAATIWISYAPNFKSHSGNWHPILGCQNR